LTDLNGFKRPTVWFSGARAISPVHLITPLAVSDLGVITALCAMNAVSTHTASAWAGQATLAGGPSARRTGSGGKHAAIFSDFSFLFIFLEYHKNFKNP
jgi:hypothetical protein